MLAGLFYFHITDQSDSKNPIKYPLVETVDKYNPFIQQFDAFQKGQLYIDVTPSPELLELENPYDPAQRNGINFLWDRALYNGHYYSYFGITPVITVYYPYYFVTGNLPSDSFVIGIFLLLTCLFFSLTIFEWANYIRKKVPLSILCVGALAGTLGTNVFLTARGMRHFYFMPILSGMAFLSMFSFFMLRSISSFNIRRYMYFALSGFLFVLVLHSRPTMAFLSVFIIIPFIWFFIINCEDEHRKIKNIIYELLALGTPVFFGLLFTLWFNNARFSSPIDFGINYQLTISDISQNQLRLSNFFYSFFHYFLQGFKYSDIYPFIDFDTIPLKEFKYFVYSDVNLGLLSNPLMYGLLASPAIIFSDKYQLRTRVILSCTIIGLLFVAWLNFSLAGVIFRYVLDLSLIASFTSILVLIILFHEFIKRKPKWLTYLTGTTLSVFFIVSIIISIRIFLISNNKNLEIIAPDVIEFFQGILPFGK